MSERPPPIWKSLVGLIDALFTIALLITEPLALIAAAVQWSGGDVPTSVWCLAVYLVCRDITGRSR